MTAILFSAIIFSACTKSSNNNTTPDLCASITCQNGGACSSGVCTCPTGYIGALCQTKATTSVQYNNNTGTPLSITINGQAETITSGGNVTFTGTYGSTASGTASTNCNFGTNLSWNTSLTTTFPASGVQIVNIDVSSNYFLLYLQNNTTTVINTLYVNYGTVAQTTETINLAANGIKYYYGYYLAYTNTVVRLATPSSYWSFNLTLPFINNQSEFLTANP